MTLWMLDKSHYYYSEYDMAKPLPRLFHCLGYRPTQFADTSKRKRPDPKAQPKSLDVPQGEKEHRKMYGITLHLDHLEASKLFLLSWIQRWKPNPAKIFGDHLEGPMLTNEPPFAEP